MQLKRHSWWIFAAGVLMISSCSTPKNVSYFPELESGTQVIPNQVNNIVVKPEDKLEIVVTTQDPVLNNLFNLVTTQNRVGGVNSSYSNGMVPYYTVDHSGDINFPVIGKIHIAGLTRDRVAEKIVKELTDKDMVKDPVVSVEFANTGVSVLGEVTKPGHYDFNRDQLSVLDAIAMAGDLTINGVRENILVMRRNEDGSKQAYRINLLDAQELAKSPAFFLQQDDIVYVEPNDKRKRETTPNGNTPYTPSFWVSIGSMATTIATLIVTISK